MNQSLRNIFMFLSLAYLFLIHACWRNILRNQNELSIESISWYFLFSLNVAAILVFTIKGLPTFIDGALPSLKAFLIAMLFCGFVLLNRVEILGNVVIDTLAVSSCLVCVAAVMPLGVLQLVQECINPYELIINWIILSLAVAIISRIVAWLLDRR